MCPRPRKATDEDVFAAAVRVMAKRGPAQLRLSDIAAEAGVTSGALVQRFGSRRDLLLQLISGMAAHTEQMFAELRATHASPLATIYAYADCMAAMGETPSGLAHHLSWLQLDLTDPSFNQEARAQAVATRAELRKLIAAAIDAGELPETVDPDGLARAIEVTVSGSLMVWGFYQEGTATDWMRTDLRALLRVHGAVEVSSG